MDNTLLFLIALATVNTISILLLTFNLIRGKQDQGFQKGGVIKPKPETGDQAKFPKGTFIPKTTMQKAIFATQALREHALTGPGPKSYVSKLDWSSHADINTSYYKAESLAMPGEFYVITKAASGDFRVNDSDSELLPVSFNKTYTFKHMADAMAWCNDREKQLLKGASIDVTA